MKSGINLYTCDVMHRRYFPQKYHFKYKVFSFLLDIDTCQDSKVSRILSFNRFNLFSIYTKDHGARDGTNWRTWIDSVLDQHQLSNAKSKVKLLCFPRVLGYTFNPLSLWYCYGQDKKLYAIICEVRNTFGEHHHYVLHNNNEAYTESVKANKTKNFHVSPFINMNAEYRFTLDAPDEKLKILINEYQDDELMLVASQLGKRKTVSTSLLLAQFFRIPLLTVKIMVLIHWQAVKIVLRGGVYHKKPKAPEEDFS